MTRAITEKQAAWLLSGDVGMSSRTIFCVMTGMANPEPYTPADPADLGRCLRLQELFPEWKPRLGEVTEKYPEWAPIVRDWANLSALYYEELPAGNAPKCYEAMRKLRYPEEAQV